MSLNASRAKPSRPGMSASEEVETFLAALDHPFKQAILAVRQIILAADPTIAEAIKWNAPSFHTSEYFATFQLRAKDCVQVILHLGARPRDSSSSGVLIAESEAMLEWLAKDRASAKFYGLTDIDAKASAFTSVIREWIKHI